MSDPTALPENTTMRYLIMIAAIVGAPIVTTQVQVPSQTADPVVLERITSLEVLAQNAAEHRAIAAKERQEASKERKEDRQVTAELSSTIVALTAAVEVMNGRTAPGGE